MSGQRFEGRSLEEALASAAAELNVEPWQLTYHVILEKRGFLGGIKRIVLEAELNPAAENPPASPKAPESSPAAAGKAPRARGDSAKREEPAPESAWEMIGSGEESAAREQKPRQTRRKRREPRRREERGTAGTAASTDASAAAERTGHQERLGDADEAAPESAWEMIGSGEEGAREQKPRQTRRRRREPRRATAPVAGDPLDEVVAAPVDESEEAARVRQWFEAVFHLSELRLQVNLAEHEGQFQITLQGKDRSRLTARGGELLDSIQVLANKALVGGDAAKRIELDCGDFKRQRERELSEQAYELADLVRKESRERLLPAMTPIERRIVHLALEEDEEVTTESRGEGFLKRVAIVPRSVADSESLTEE